MTRSELPSRRAARTVRLAWQSLAGVDHHVLVTFGFDADWKIKEAFVASYRAESGIIGLTNDACIFYSRLLQHGDTLEELVAATMEDRPEGAATGKPASLIGAVARKAVEVQKEVDEEKKR